MLMEISLPKMGDLLVMMMTMISPSGRDVPPAESFRKRAKVLLPKFRLETAALRPKCPILIFFLGQNDLYIPEEGHWMWAWVSTTHQGAPGLPGVPRWVVPTSWPLWYLFAPIILKYSIKNPREVSAHLELCRIGSLT